MIEDIKNRLKLWFKNLQIKQKILFVFAIITGIIIFIGLQNYLILKHINKEINQIHYSLQLSENITNMHNSLHNMHDYMKELQVNLTDKNKGLLKDEIDNFNNIDAVQKRLNISLHKDKNISINRVELDSLEILWLNTQHKMQQFSQKLDIRKTSHIRLNELMENRTSVEEIDSETGEVITRSSNIVEIQLIQEKLKKENYDIQILVEGVEKLITNMEHRFMDIQVILKNNMNVEKENTKKQTGQMKWVLIIGIFVFVVFFFLFFKFLTNHVITPLHQLARQLFLIAKGELPEKIKIDNKDEVGDMSRGINDLITTLHKTADFALEIEKGNFESEFVPASEKDSLGNALIDMRSSLKKADDSQKERQAEDKIRNWETQGIAKFGDILQQNTDDLEDLGNDIIRNMVKYLESNQGGIFIYNQEYKDEKYLELIASYAYNRKKFISKKIEIGEGLIGTCALEMKSIHLIELPEDYIEITSGLGKSTPRNLLIVPLILEGELYGIIELASFNKFIEYEISFVEKIAENIAATLSTVKVNEKTNKLLRQSREQAEALQAQEEEMRQNMEEMQATQEETTRRENDLRKSMDDLTQIQEELDQKDKIQQKEIKKLTQENEKKMKEILLKEKQSWDILQSSLDAVVISNEKGLIEFFNPTAQKIWGYTEEEILGENLNILMNENDAKHHDSYMNNYLSTRVKKIIGIGREVEIKRKDGTKTWIHLSVIENKLEEESKFTGFVRDLTKEKELEKKRNELFEKLIAEELKHKEKVKNLEEHILSNDLEIPDFQKEEDLITWNDDFVLGIENIENQHKEWIFLINNMYKELRSGKARKFLLELLEEFTEFTDIHFKYEEQYFEYLEEQNAEMHFAEHKGLLLKLKDYLTKYKEGDTEIIYSLMTFLQNRIVPHILYIDSTYVKDFKRNGIL